MDRAEDQNTNNRRTGLNKNQRLARDTNESGEDEHEEHAACSIENTTNAEDETTPWHGMWSEILGQDTVK